MTDKTAMVGGILDIMRSCWDLPADCNDGELFTYAEMLLDRIQTGESEDALYSFLADVQLNNLEMPRSDAYREIVDRSLALVKNSNDALPKE